MMTRLDTSGSSEATTQPETNNGQEFEVKSDRSFEIITAAHCGVGTVPSDLPEVAAEGGNYVFRVASGSSVPQIIITLDTQHLTEQARVRKVNQAIRRARRQ
jgi:hypothetical protein